MRFIVTFKTPCTTDTSIEDALDDEFGSEDLDADGEDGLHVAREACHRLVERFVRSGECVDVEFDTDAGTAVVVPRATRTTW